jgi:hypothetical protein
MGRGWVQVEKQAALKKCGTKYQIFDVALMRRIQTFQHTLYICLFVFKLAAVAAVVVVVVVVVIVVAAVVVVVVGGVFNYMSLNYIDCVASKGRYL